MSRDVRTMPQVTDRSPKQRHRLHAGLPRFAAIVLGFMILVILEGAVVRATGSGAGCGNHWPLCNGDFFPHHPRVATIIEYAHRSLTAVLTLLVAGLVAWAFVARPRGTRMRKAAAWSGVLLLTEAFLGAVLVKGGYVEHNASDMRVLMQCIHFTNTMLLTAALALTWWWSRERPTPSIAQDAGTRTAAWVALASTIVVGATGSVAALADTLFPSPSLLAGLADDFQASSPLLWLDWPAPSGSACALGAGLDGGSSRSSLRRSSWVSPTFCFSHPPGCRSCIYSAPTSIGSHL
jgi:cytochrome c oxidase assembly protein subunit 15